MNHLALIQGLYLSIVQNEKAFGPKPLESGFSQNFSYLALGLFNPSETSEAYFVMSNDRKEIWFISNRHLRFHHIDAFSNDSRTKNETNSVLKLNQN